jgi:hypothetical protein
MATQSVFTTIRAEGALLPPDLLQRVADANSDLGGLTPGEYHLSGEKINEAINYTWNRLQGAWATFKTAQARLPENDWGTTITRERWLLPLFRELDYGRLHTATATEIDGKSYAISHLWGDVPIHLVSYKIDLDKRTQGYSGATAASPHSLLQVFLNRSDDHLWGFVSNGHKLRILRDNVSLTRQAYVEFDLEAMMEGEVYSDFVLLWLLCHQSRVDAERPTDYWLEKWAKAAQEQGTRALDQLRDGVQRAIEALGAGFIAHTANTDLRDKLQAGELDKQDYYRQLLRLVYRLLFLFVAEDRDLLLDPTTPDDAQDRYRKYYSTRRLRNVAEKLKGTRHHDLYESLRLVMQLLSGQDNGKGQAIGLPVLGSFLFSDNAVNDIINAKISNRDLLNAIRALAFTEDRSIRVLRPVDYKHLGPEELGSVYESLLELHPEINISAKSFSLATAGGNERKTTGSYYTPSSLINALLDSALDPVLAEATRNGEDAVLDLKICDPACGSGHFLIAASHRMAKALAFVRTGEEEPPPDAIQQAKRDIIGHCIYGVDINPMAVELCKVNLWMEALEPGKPLSFLDHRIQCGNSLLGTTPALMAEGIPDNAFKPIEGDDKKFVSTMKKVNKTERKQRAAGVLQHDMFAQSSATDYGYLTQAINQLDTIPDATMAGIRHKEAQYAALADDAKYVKARLLADAWCAAFVWEKTPPPAPPHNNGEGSYYPLPMTDLLYRRMEDDPLAENLQTVRQTIVQLTERYAFFHWHIAFPDVFTVPDETPENEQTGWNGGFDVVLGNPPWDQIQLDAREFFALSAPDIAGAANMAARNRMVKKLVHTNPELHALYENEKRKLGGVKHFLHSSNGFPLSSFGRLNTAPLFCELARKILNNYGFTGMLVPVGIVTDSFNQYLFSDIVANNSLVSVLGFENEDMLFPAVDHTTTFCLFVLSGSNRRNLTTDFMFFARQVDHLSDINRHYRLTAEEIIEMNPNTRTSAIFRTGRDAKITSQIYRFVPILVSEGFGNEKNSWNITIKLMFMMNTDSHLFQQSQEIDTTQWVREENRYVKDAQILLPLYEAKMMHQFDHRFATYEGATAANYNSGIMPQISLEQKQRSDNYTFPNYWVDSSEVAPRVSDWEHKWFICYRAITKSRNERTAIFGIIPFSAVGNSSPVIMPSVGIELLLTFVANVSSCVFDFVARQKTGGNNFNFFIVKQLPAIPPHTYTPALLDFIVPRVLELSYTAWDLQPFAKDVGYNGAPFVWDEERRFLMRCELDALYFHLYQIGRDDVDYIMETFPIVKRKDIKRTAGEDGENGEFLTKKVILTMYDEMAELPFMDVPAPKDADEMYAVPDVSQWATWLNPGPADVSVAHAE